MLWYRCAVPEPETVKIAEELRAVVGEMMRAMRAHAAVMDVTRSQSAVLGYLEREGASTTADLARAHGMRQQSMSAIIAALTAAGLVEGSPDPSDGRKTLQRITAGAREEIRVGRLQRADWLGHALETALTPDEITRIGETVDLLRRVARVP